MDCCEINLATPEENIACDEALLESREAGEGGEFLRFWEPAQHFVVLGYANKAATEVNQDVCRAHSIPVLRRCSGGGTVLQGPGVLNYSLVLQIPETGPLRSIAGTNRFILGRHRDALAPLLRGELSLRGQTDLALGSLKFSGNAQRRRRNFLLYHGSFLLGLDLGLMEKTLLMPSRQPDYRNNRSHSEFVVNLNVSARTIKNALQACWDASERELELPRERIASIARSGRIRGD